MNSIAITFLCGSALALLLVPRKWAPLPLIAGACYMTLGQGLEIGPFSFTVVRILLLVGAIRVVLRGERLIGAMHGLDWLMILWGVWAAVSSAFHEPFVSSLVFRLGMVYNACGIYFLARIFCSSVGDMVRLVQMIALLLVPVAIAMVYEQVANFNPFSVLGGVNVVPEIREGRLRATGPFAHPILAGTVGAVSLPLMIGIWPHKFKSACVGAVACVVMVITSSSSGPAVSTMCGIGALLMWRLRRHMKMFRWVAVLGYIALSLGMRAPAYYLIARIDLVGGSTGWYRARLIESSLEHLNEWWLAGTDYTRHWMETGLEISTTQTDITNHYLSMGVLGGLPLMLLLILILWKSFWRVGRALQNGSMSASDQFVFWGLGASLAAHAATWVSISYFDQSVVFLYLTIAAVGSPRSQSVSFMPDSTSVTPVVPSSRFRSIPPRRPTTKVSAWPGRADKLRVM